jgi:hypothetical protein
MITADQIAATVVAACRETGEDPFKCVAGLNGGLPGLAGNTCRARHYALQALRDVTVTDPLMLARLVGSPCDPAVFLRVSTFQVAKRLHGLGRRKALWWDEEEFDRVVLALRAASPAPGAKVRSTGFPKQVNRIPEAAAHGPARTNLDKFVDRDAPRDDQAGGDDQLARRAVERRACRDLLAEAAANTAKLQAKLPPEPDD